MSNLKKLGKYCYTKWATIHSIDGFTYWMYSLMKVEGFVLDTQYVFIHCTGLFLFLFKSSVKSSNKASPQLDIRQMYVDRNEINFARPSIIIIIW